MKIRLPLWSTACVTAAVFFASNAYAVSASLLNIDFGALYAPPEASYGAASGQTGVWNKINSGGAFSLADVNGNASGVTLTLSSQGDLYQGGGPGHTGNELALLDDNFFDWSGGWSLTLSGLENGTYDLYYYASNNANVPTGNFSVNGQNQTSIGVSASGDTFTEGVNWGKISGVIVTNGNISFLSTDSLAGLSGLQVVAVVPEPGTYVLLGIAGSCLLILGRRKQQAS